MTPIYDYRCSSQTCQFHADIMHPITGSETPLLCPLCGAALWKVPSVPAPPVGGPTPRFFPDRW